jgi:hypothetical protein
LRIFYNLQLKTTDVRGKNNYTDENSMKKLILILGLAVFVISCSRKLEKFELFSLEAFAYTMDSGWELNTSLRAKGFDQKEEGNKFSAKLSYYADLETPDGKLAEKICSGVLDKTAGEKMTDIPIEAQIKLSASSVKGIYKITFYVKDEMTDRRAKVSNFFELN